LFNLDAGSTNLYRGISVSGALDVHINHSPGDMITSVALKNLILRKDHNTEDLNNFSFSFHSSDSLVLARIEADFLKADMHFVASLGDLKRVFTAGRFKGILLVDSAMENKIPYISLLPEMSVSIEST
jgi:hypothetical protein